MHAGELSEDEVGSVEPGVGRPRVQIPCSAYTSLGDLEPVAISQPGLPLRVVVNMKWGWGEPCLLPLCSLEQKQDINENYKML